MAAYLYNLVPAMDEINALRKNFSFAMIPRENSQFGKCKIKIVSSKVDPSPDFR